MTDGPQADNSRTDNFVTQGLRTDSSLTDSPRTQGPGTDSPRTDGSVNKGPRTDGPVTNAPLTDGLLRGWLRCRRRAWLDRHGPSELRRWNAHRALALQDQHLRFQQFLREPPGRGPKACLEGASSVMGLRLRGPILAGNWEEIGEEAVTDLALLIITSNYHLTACELIAAGWTNRAMIPAALAGVVATVD